MNSKVVFLDGVDYLYLLTAFRKDVTCVTDLSSHLGIERSALEHELIHCLVLCLHRAVAGKLNALKLGAVISEELDVVAMSELHPVSRLDCCSVAGSVLLLLELDLEAFEVDGIALLGSDELRKVDREAECIIKHECILS